MTTSDIYADGLGSPGAGEAGGNAGNQGMLNQLQDAAGSVANQASDTAGSVAGQAKDQVGSQLDDQRERFAGTLGSAAKALRQTGQQLRSDDQGNVAALIDRAAERLDGFSRYLGERRLDDLINDVERFGRDEPGIFLTAAFGAGLLAARFLKSSNRGSDSPARTASQRTRPTPARFGNTPGSAGPTAFSPSPQRAGSPTDDRRAAPATNYAGTAIGASADANGHGGESNLTENAGNQ